MNKIKYLSLVLVFGITINTAVFANTIKEYILTEPAYDIVINNDVYNDVELPVLNYQGNTYIPLKKVGDVLDANVSWNSEKQRVEILNKKTTLIPDSENININDIMNKYLCYFYAEKNQNTSKLQSLELYKNEASFYNNETPIVSDIEFKIIRGIIYLDLDYFNKKLKPLLSIK